jgi:hypothetical protein
MPTTITPLSERPSGAGSADSRMEIDSTRPRQTDRPVTPFRDVLTGGVSLLMSGAEVATHVVAGPVMAAAVHDARVGALTALGGGPGGGGTLGGTLGGAAGGGMLGGAAGPTSPVAALGAAAAGMAGAAGGPMAGGGGSSDMTNVQAMMQEGQSSNMQLLALQQQIQEESQRFSTVSNVMRAKFDTAKAAVSNIRA